jgi:hypothetical protein
MLIYSIKRNAFLRRFTCYLLLVMVFTDQMHMLQCKMPFFGPNRSLPLFLKNPLHSWPFEILVENISL